MVKFHVIQEVIADCQLNPLVLKEVAVDDFMYNEKLGDVEGFAK